MVASPRTMANIRLIRHRDHMSLYRAKHNRLIVKSNQFIRDRREDTVEFFNLVQGLKLTDQEKKSLVAFMRAL